MSQVYYYLIQIGGALQIFYLLDGLTVTEITHLPRWILPAAFLHLSRMINLLKLGVCLQQKDQEKQGFLNYFLSLCYWEKLRILIILI